MADLASIRQTHRLIRPFIIRTPLLPLLPGLTLKPECLQACGSFKIRGAFSKLLSLNRSGHGVVAYSSGNHGLAVAYACQRLGIPATIVLPEDVPQSKLQSIVRYRAAVQFSGYSSLERQRRAEQISRDEKLDLIPPYDDEAVINGAGTIGLELLEDLPDLDTVFVPVGGGALLAGIATAIKSIRLAVRVIGVEPESANDAQRSLAAGTIQKNAVRSNTIADGLRTLCVGDRDYAHIRGVVDEIVTVSDREVLRAMKVIFSEARIVAEPSGAVATVAAISRSDCGKAVAIVSGGNVDPEIITAALAA